VLSREAVAGDDLGVLQRDVLASFRKVVADEERGQRGAGRLEGALLRNITDYMRLERHAVHSRQLRGTR
jgi:hypothetical protein